MPRSGQAWNPEFLRGERLFAPFEWLAGQLRGAAWPTTAQLTSLGEAARLRTGEPLRTLSFRQMEPLGRRRKRGPVRLSATYDGSIAEHGEVPCLSASYHDLFNAIAFAAFPRSKRALHERQYRALIQWAEEGAAQLPGARTREQDALTIFDEGGMVVCMTAERARAHRGVAFGGPVQAPPGSGAALAPLRVDDLLGQGLEILTFGHALLEHLHDGHDYSRSSGVLVVLPDAAFTSFERLLDEADRILCARLGDALEFREPGADLIVELVLDDGASPRRGKGTWLGPLKDWSGTLPDAPHAAPGRGAGECGAPEERVPREGERRIPDEDAALRAARREAEPEHRLDSRTEARHLGAPS